MRGLAPAERPLSDLSFRVAITPAFISIISFSIFSPFHLICFRFITAGWLSGYTALSPLIF